MDFLPWVTTNILWISAKLAHKQLKKGAYDANFEGKKQQPKLKGRTLIWSQLRSYSVNVLLSWSILAWQNCGPCTRCVVPFTWYSCHSAFDPHPSQVFSCLHASIVTAGAQTNWLETIRVAPPSKLQSDVLLTAGSHFIMRDITTWGWTGSHEWCGRPLSCWRSISIMLSRAFNLETGPMNISDYILNISEIQEYFKFRVWAQERV